MFTDSHCHLNYLNLEKYDGQLQGAIDAMSEAKVTRAMAIMCKLSEYDSIYDIIHNYSKHDSTQEGSRADTSANSSLPLTLGMSVGVHPCGDLPILQGATEQVLMEMASADYVWAIGETGLDYYWSDENKQEQQACLARHIHVSQQLKKPLVIHTREAKHDTIDILTAENAEHGIIHCFTEDWEMAKKALDLGFYISFSGIVSFKNAQDLRDVAIKVPKDRLLIETDSPYLAPVPKRGKHNEPAFVPYVAACLAELFDMSAEEVGIMTAKNFDNLLAQYD